MSRGKKQVIKLLRVVTKQLSVRRSPKSRLSRRSRFNKEIWSFLWFSILWFTYDSPFRSIFGSPTDPIDFADSLYVLNQRTATPKIPTYRTTEPYAGTFPTYVILETYTSRWRSLLKDPDHRGEIANSKRHQPRHYRDQLSQVFPRKLPSPQVKVRLLVVKGGKELAMERYLSNLPVLLKPHHFLRDPKAILPCW
jgi:hypothetical protein